MQYRLFQSLFRYSFITTQCSRDFDNNKQRPGDGLPNLNKFQVSASWFSYRNYTEGTFKNPDRVSSQVYMICSKWARTCKNTGIVFEVTLIRWSLGGAKDKKQQAKMAMHVHSKVIFLKKQILKLLQRIYHKLVSWYVFLINILPCFHNVTYNIILHFYWITYFALTLFEIWMSSMKKCTCFSPLFNASVLVTTATSMAVQATP